MELFAAITKVGQIQTLDGHRTQVDLLRGFGDGQAAVAAGAAAGMVVNASISAGSAVVVVGAGLG